MTDYTPHQRKIIDRYYEHKNEIMLAKLSELVGELYLAEADTTSRACQKAVDRLWQRVARAMKNLKVKPDLAAHILEKRDPRLLAAHLKDWLAQS